MLFGAKEKTLEIQNASLDYITFGTGKRPLIMIQGLNTNGIHGMALPLAFMYRIFAKDFKVYLFERRQILSEGITVREMAADVATAMDALKIRQADVFGVSQGGMIAQYLAIDRPDLVKKLVLAVTLSQNNETICSVIEAWIKMTGQGDMNALVRDMSLKMYSDKYIKKYEKLMSLLTVLQKPKDVRRFQILAKSCLTCRAYDELSHIQCPVFVLGGREDKIVGAKASEEIAEKLKCKLYLYDNLGHAAYEEAKDFNQRVYDFLMNGII